jgi:hypothetical protein
MKPVNGWYWDSEFHYYYSFAMSLKDQSTFLFCTSTNPKPYVDLVPEYGDDPSLEELEEEYNENKDIWENNE